MQTHRHRILLPLAALVLGACSEPAPTYWETLTARSADGAMPAGWVVEETNTAGRPATWEFRDGAIRVAETTNAGKTYNLLVAPENRCLDFSASLRIRADKGREDRGGGLAWRLQDRNNYYCARWNPLEGNVRAYKVVDGTRTQIATADVAASPGGWHDMKFEVAGGGILVHFDGKAVLDVSDPTFRESGAIGLWTKADAATSFGALDIVVIR